MSTCLKRKKLPDIAKALDTTAASLLGEDKEEVPDWGLRDRVFSEEHMYTFVKATATAKSLAGTLRALPFAKDKHKGQVRKGNDHMSNVRIVPLQDYQAKLPVRLNSIRTPLDRNFLLQFT